MKDARPSRDHDQREARARQVAVDEVLLQNVEEEVRRLEQRPVLGARRHAHRLLRAAESPAIVVPAADSLPEPCADFDFFAISVSLNSTLSETLFLPVFVGPNTICP